ncbi:MAG: methylated-DNA--[protein]-cysteine S-methyltransferase [bacterium]
MKIYIHSFDTNIGKINTASTEKGLALLTLPGETKSYFDKKIKELYPDYEIGEGGKINKQAEKEIKAYLSGKLKKFDVSLDLQATTFQIKVLNEVARIPYGKTKTYGDIAKSINNPKAFRAVGTANAQNKIPIIIPCHRVVASNGLGGYGGGLDLKKKLLNLEMNLEVF